MKSDFGFLPAAVRTTGRMSLETGNRRAALAEAAVGVGFVLAHLAERNPSLNLGGMINGHNDISSAHRTPVAPVAAGPTTPRPTHKHGAPKLKL